MAVTSFAVTEANYFINAKFVVMRLAIAVRSAVVAVARLAITLMFLMCSLAGLTLDKAKH